MGEKRVNYFEACYNILEYLRKNTDKEHPITKKDLQDVGELEEYVKGGEEVTRRVEAIAQALNGIDYKKRGYDESKFRLVYGTAKNKFDKMTNLYYNPIFTHEEISIIEDGILVSRSLDSKKAQNLLQKIEDNLANKFYRRDARNVCKMKPVPPDEDRRLKENLRIISQAINDNVQIEMIFCGYDLDNKLDLESGDKTRLSPYYIVADGGRYYLLCAYERTDDKDYERKMYIYRIDTMVDVKICRRESDGKTMAATPKHNVHDLPQEWNDEFFVNHMNMAYGNPRSVKLRVKVMNDGKKLPLTFLHDCFGDRYTVEKDQENDNYKVISVRCAEFSMVNWALQYSDRVEVLSPPKIREAVKDRVRELAEKYALGDCKRLQENGG